MVECAQRLRNFGLGVWAMTDGARRDDEDAPVSPAPTPRLPRYQASCSQAGYRFQLRHFQIFDFFLFAVRLSTAADSVRFRAAEALAVEGNEEEIANFELVKKNPTPAFSKLQSFSAYHSELMIIRLVDNFMCFLSETLQLCMSKLPELLRSKEQIKTEDILRFTNRRDLVDFLVNRKLNELSYGGLRGIEEFLEQRLNIALVSDDTERVLLSVAIELRNIYTHNRGLVNELFLSRIAGYRHDYEFRQGKRYHAGFDEIVRSANNLFDIATRLDSQALTKFSLRKRRYSTWNLQRTQRNAKTARQREANGSLPGTKKRSKEAS